MDTDMMTLTLRLLKHCLAGSVDNIIKTGENTLKYEHFSNMECG